MLVRIVKLTFKEEFIQDFLESFEKNKKVIRTFEGCAYLELLQDKHNKNIFFTYSYWKNEAALNKYRNSDTFKGIWKTTKPWFSINAEAWSVTKVETLD